MSAQDQAARWADLRSQQSRVSRNYLENRRSRLLINLERFSVHIEKILLEGFGEKTAPGQTIKPRTELEKQVFASPFVKSVSKNRGGSLWVKSRAIGKDRETATTFRLLLKPNESGCQIVDIRRQTGNKPMSEDSMDGSLKQAQMMLEASGNFRTVIAYVIAEGLAHDDPTLPGAPHPDRSVIRRLSLLAASSNPVWSIELVETFMHGSMFCRDLARIDELLQKLAAVPEKSPEEYRAEYERLCQLPRIESLTVEEQEIRAQTRCVYLYDKEGVRRQIGRFCITIDTEQACVRIHNLDHKMDRHDHPHVVEGNPCWGNMNLFLANKTLEGAWPDVLIQAVEFVFSVNHGDCYCPVSKFPAA
ncbi:MAG: hypothetical protein JXJ17_01815 [Anaerolineae bacterium]|nr:hypothetical protein [Anaerolineae bacterium]